MTSEEIKALDLRVEGSGSEIYDVTIRCHVSELAESEDYIQAEVGDGVILKSIIVAMERVMPELPDGWVWINSTAGVYMVWNEESNIRASIIHDGQICCWSMEPGNNSHVKLPALVAKALLDVWGRTQ